MQRAKLPIICSAAPAPSIWRTKKATWTPQIALAIVARSLLGRAFFFRRSVKNFTCLFLSLPDSTLQKTPTDLEVSTLLATWLSNACAEDTAKIEKLQKEVEAHKGRERELKSQTRKTRADLRHIAKKLQDCNSDLTYVVDDIEMYFADAFPA